MGTRADFYVGRGQQAEWLGSIAWDGYPCGIDDVVKVATDEPAYRLAVESFFDGRDDVTRPEQGWPWPWENSRTTDYAYAFDGRCVWSSCFGSAWWKATDDQPDDPDDAKVADFPDMTSRKAVTLGKRSGLMVIGVNGPIHDLP